MGKRHGEDAKMKYQDGSVYNGTYKHDQRNGKGTYVKNSVKFEGIFKNDQKYYGIEKSGDKIYTGFFQNNLAHGKGQITKYDTIFEGIWLKGEQPLLGKVT